jgi:hypothetical protein
MEKFLKLIFIALPRHRRGFPGRGAVVSFKFPVLDQRWKIITSQTPSGISKPSSAPLQRRNASSWTQDANTVLPGPRATMRPWGANHCQRNPIECNDLRLQLQQEIAHGRQSHAHDVFTAPPPQLTRLTTPTTSTEKKVLFHTIRNLFSPSPPKNQVSKHSHATRAGLGQHATQNSNANLAPPALPPKITTPFRSNRDRLTALEAEVQSLGKEDEEHHEINQRIRILEEKKLALLSKHQSLPPAKPPVSHATTLFKNIKRQAPSVPAGGFQDQADGQHAAQPSVLPQPDKIGNFSLDDFKSLVSEVAKASSSKTDPGIPSPSTSSSLKTVSGAHTKISATIVQQPILYPHMGIHVDAFKRDDSGNFWTGLNLDPRLFVSGFLTNLLGDLPLKDCDDMPSFLERVRLVRE